MSGLAFKESQGIPPSVAQPSDQLILKLGSEAVCPEEGSHPYPSKKTNIANHRFGEL